MAIYKSEVAAGRQPVVTPVNSDGTTLRYEYVFPATHVAGDVIVLGDLPANKFKPLDCSIVCDDLDSGAGIVLSAGILAADLSAMGAGANDTWIASSTVGQTGGFARATTPNVLLSGPQEFARRPLGIVINTSAATPAMAGKKIVLIVDGAA